MSPAGTVQRTYLVLTLLNTLAASFIWGINTLFLLDAGLSNTEAFAANAAFSVGSVLFEVPTGSFAVALALLAGWALVFATLAPLRQAFINGVIPSEQRATVLSFDSLIGSTGGVVVPPVLGRVADVNGYGASYLVAAGIQVLSLTFVLLARRERAISDPIDDHEAKATTGVG